MKRELLILILLLLNFFSCKKKVYEGYDEYIGEWYETENKCEPYIKIDMISHGEYKFLTPEDACKDSGNGKVKIGNKRIKIGGTSFKILEKPIAIPEKFIKTGNNCCDSIKINYRMTLKRGISLGVPVEGTFYKKKI